jgi:hypothetical protein
MVLATAVSRIWPIQ